MISVSPLSASVPVFVAETLTTAEGKALVYIISVILLSWVHWFSLSSDLSKLSARFGDNNLLWLVANRHVFIWSFKGQQVSESIRPF